MQATATFHLVAKIELNGKRAAKPKCRNSSAKVKDTSWLIFRLKDTNSVTRVLQPFLCHIRTQFSQFRFQFPLKRNPLVCDSYLEPQGVFFVVLSHSCFRRRAPSNSSADILRPLQKAARVWAADAESCRKRLQPQRLIYFVVCSTSLALWINLVLRS